MTVKYRGPTWPNGYFQVKAEDGNIHPMQFEKVINCAGPWAGEVGKLAGIGIDGGELKIPIPVEPRYI